MLDLETILNLQHGDVLHSEWQQSSARLNTKCPRWRVSGKVQRWKRDPERFRVPIKYGLYNNDALLPGDERSYHLESECTGDSPYFHVNRGGA